MWARINENDLIKYPGRMMGRVHQYNHMDGYGFIYTEIANDIFFSSYDMGKKIENKIMIGSIVSFLPIVRDGKIVATEFELVNSSPNGKVIILPNGEHLNIRKIHRFGIGKLSEAELSQGEDLEELQLEEIEYVYINTTQCDYKFFNYGSRFENNGSVEVNQYIKELNDFFLYL